MTEACYLVLAANVKAARKAAGITQASLARDIGMTRTNLANLEAGRVRTPVHRLLDIATVLDIEYTRLLDGMAGQRRMPTPEEIGDAVMALNRRRKLDPPSET